MLKESAVEPELPAVSEGVEVYRRAEAGKNVFIFENFSGHAETIHLIRAMSNVLDGGRAQNVTLEQYGVAVMEEQTSGSSRKSVAE
jgi:hypothetical protein